MLPSRIVTQGVEKIQHPKTTIDYDFLSHVSLKNKLTKLGIWDSDSDGTHLYRLLNRPLGSATCNNCEFGQCVGPFALIENLATMWHHLHWLNIWPPGGATFKSKKFGQKHPPDTPKHP